MTGFLTDTLIWTGLLIALVLVIRRPVARFFGPKAAYALWLLPMLRLVMPPLILPSWMRSMPPAEPSTMVVQTGPQPALMDADGVPSVSEIPLTALQTASTSIDWVNALVAVWLIGAAAFLVHRFTLYFQLRREMLDEAVAVGEAGAIRLLETDATSGPVAFGVRDKIVILPIGFMAQRDRQMRDLALMHELSHHRGHDLLVNFLVQPLFALHWFNPLGWSGWRALRRDQEAACDARVVADLPRPVRADYAQIIARFAAGPQIALAAPMACPVLGDVLGDKSIIQRLRSLSMSDPTPRRRIAGKLLLAGAAIALPLTASVTYAEVETQQTSDSASLPPIPPQPPIAPRAPTSAVTPTVPDAPAPPDFDTAFADSDAEYERSMAMTEGEQEQAGLEMERAGLEMKRAGLEMERAGLEMKRAEKEMKRASLKGAAHGTKHGKDGHRHHVETRIERHTHNGKTLERKVTIVDGKKVVSGNYDDAEVRKALRDANVQVQFVERKLAEGGEIDREIKAALAEARSDVNVRVLTSCGQRENISETTSEDGATTIRICTSRIASEAMGQARQGLIEARAAIAADPDIQLPDKKRTLRTLDRQIAQMSENT